VPGKFELYKDLREYYRFRLISESGELVLSGEGYTQKVSALDAVVSIMRSASEAEVIDLTLTGSGEAAIEDGPDIWDEGQSETAVEEQPRKKKRKRKGGKKASKGKKSKNRKRSKQGKKKGKRKNG
jgi:uncharacterized protein